MHIPSFRHMPESSNGLKINFWMTRYARPVDRTLGVQLLKLNKQIGASNFPITAYIRIDWQYSN